MTARRAWRARLPWLALAVLVAVPIGVVAWPDGEPSPDARTRRLAEELRCPDCQGLSAAESSTPTARAIRADVRDRITAGQTDAEIREAMVDRYGESILLRPEGSGLGLLIFGLPVAALLLGGLGLVLALRRWRREPVPVPTDADRALVRKARA